MRLVVGAGGDLSPDPGDRLDMSGNGPAAGGIDLSEAGLVAQAGAALVAVDAAGGGHDARRARLEARAARVMWARFAASGLGCASH